MDSRDLKLISLEAGSKIDNILGIMKRELGELTESDWDHYKLESFPWGGNLVQGATFQSTEVLSFRITWDVYIYEMKSIEVLRPDFGEIRSRALSDLKTDSFDIDSHYKYNSLNVDLEKSLKYMNIYSNIPKETKSYLPGPWWEDLGDFAEGLPEKLSSFRKEYTRLERDRARSEELLLQRVQEMYCARIR